ncbi:MAG: HTH-type transcriptional activator IlvY [Spirochaetia bacterium]
MDLHAMKLFIHLSETLHFARTSRECAVSPSALSRSVKRLEEETGVPLFLRDNRRVELTREGREFAEYARKTLSEWNRLQARLKSSRGEVRGAVSLYATVTACYAILPEILSRFKKSYPGVRITLKTGDAASAIPRVQDGSADLSIAPVPDRLSEELKSVILLTTPLVFIAQDNLYHRAIDDWGRVPLILPERGLARERIDRWYRKNGLAQNVYAQAAGNEAIIAVTALGFGVGLVPRLVLKQSQAREKLKIIKGGPELEPYRVALIGRKKEAEFSPAVNAFWETAGLGFSNSR